MSFFKNIQTKNQKLIIPFFKEKELEVYMKREDLIHPIISGNKFRKLKYNILSIDKKNQLISFGGAYSNHLLALSYIGKHENLNTVGIVRGEELKNIELNPTLKRCLENGMKLKFVDRNEYRSRNNEYYIEKLKNTYKNSVIIPEGGTNKKGIKGCEEILSDYDKAFFDVICVPVGSGGTFSGLINSSSKKQLVIGFSSLKNSNLKNDINKFVVKNNWKLIDEDYFGGYAKFNQELISFINNFYEITKIKLDPIYNSKMIFRIIDMIKKNKWRFGKRILIINTGGLQSLESFNKLLKNKKCETISYSI